MKGIVMAGGTATRLYPLTRVVSKHLLPIYDKPMIYYPLSTLMLAGIREVLVISTPHDLPQYRKLLRDGSDLGMSIQYEEQRRAGGIAEAFIVGRNFIGRDSVALVLGDNVFYGPNLSVLLQDAVRANQGATIFAYYVKNPQDYGVAVFNADGRVTAIEEKPSHPTSNHAITGFYVYDNRIVEIVKGLRPSARGELEITDVNNTYLKEERLRVIPMGRGYAWLDTGTYATLTDASNFIATIERRQDLKVACLEEVAFRMGFIGPEELGLLAEGAPNEEYRRYLQRVLVQEPRMPEHTHTDRGLQREV